MPRDPTTPWLPGQRIARRGRIKLVALGGAGSQSGTIRQQLSGLMAFLARDGGYDPVGDLLEASYAGRPGPDGGWLPQPYRAADTRQALSASADAVAGALDWYRDALPSETQLVVLGYSLGGVVALDGATLAVARDRAGWAKRLRAVITLASPLRGSSAGLLVSWAWVATSDPEGLGQAGEDLRQRWDDAEEQTRLERRAAFLRAHGTVVQTLADPDDAVVRPEEALLPAPNETARDMLVRSGGGTEAILGHGALFHATEVWRRVLRVAGPQQVGSGGSDQRGDALDAEIAAIKARLRAEGRLR